MFYQGSIAASKSLLNRALIVQSYQPELSIIGSSQSEDVLKVKQSLSKLESRQPLDCGSGGTTLRFLALRASRIPGKFTLLGSPRLFARPQLEILRMLGQLGVHAELLDSTLIIQGEGWKFRPEPLQIDMSQSSQFASSLLMNAFNLDFDLCLDIVGEAVSWSYWQMSLSMLTELGLRFEQNGRKIFVPKGQRPRQGVYEVEPDMSSAFALAALALAKGESLITNFPHRSLQPDFAFVEILRSMGAKLVFEANSLRILPLADQQLRGISANLRDSPDLFPVLAVLCAKAQGKSRIYGAPHLAFKESNRLHQTAKLLRNMNVDFVLQEDGMEITGGSQSCKHFEFDPDQDHRMAMAASVAKAFGASLTLLKPEVLNKSFPELRTILD